MVSSLDAAAASAELTRQLGGLQDRWAAGHDCDYGGLELPCEIVLSGPSKNGNMHDSTEPLSNTVKDYQMLRNKTTAAPCVAKSVDLELLEGNRSIDVNRLSFLEWAH